MDKLPYLAVDAHGMPHIGLITKGPQADCKQAGKLISSRDGPYYSC